VTDNILRQFGFSDYEARAYAAVVRGGLMTGYEVARAAQVPRPNIYAVLDKLVERGAVRRFDAEGGVRYGATPPRQLIEALNRQYSAALAAAEAELEALATPAAFGYVWNLSGYDSVIRHARDLIGAARGSLMIAIQPAEATALAAEMAAAHERGLRVTTLCMQACANECGGCQGDLHRCFVEPAPGHRALLVVADDNRLLAADIASNSDSFAVRTEERLVVELAAAYIRQSISIAALGRDLDLESALSSDVQARLSSLEPGGDFIGAVKRLVGATR